MQVGERACRLLINILLRFRTGFEFSRRVHFARFLAIKLDLINPTCKEMNSITLEKTLTNFNKGQFKKKNEESFRSS